QDFSLLEKDLRVGVRPDVYVLPCPLQDHSFDRFHAYRTDTPVPVFVVEVVSPSNWSKDYQHAPEKYAMLGVEELLLCDPLALEGKSSAPEPYLLQLYRKVSGGKLKRMYAGEGPVWSESVGAWFRVEGELLKVSRDREGKSRVLSYKEGEEEAEAKAEMARASRESAEEQRLAAEEQRRLAEEQERVAQEQRLAAEERERTAEAQAMADAREALVDLCDVLAIELTSERQAHLASLDLPALRSLRALLKQAKRWPT
nr:Uma2 family endonuclease [Polyangiaceae bacterium]